MDLSESVCSDALMYCTPEELMQCWKGSSDADTDCTTDRVKEYPHG